MGQKEGENWPAPSFACGSAVEGGGEEDGAPVAVGGRREGKGRGKVSLEKKEKSGNAHHAAGAQVMG